MYLLVLVFPRDGVDPDRRCPLGRSEDYSSLPNINRARTILCLCPTCHAAHFITKRNIYVDHPSNCIAEIYTLSYPVPIACDAI